MKNALLHRDNAATELFESRLVARPFCCDSPAEGVYRLPLAEALNKRLIQPNSARLTGALCFDIDRPMAAIAWMDANLPEPNFVLKNPANGHAHIAYLLAAPIAVSDAACLKPLRYMAAVQHALGRALGADVGYSSLLVKNPRHPAWEYACWRLEPYSLAELAETLDLPTAREIRRSLAECEGVGRNATMLEVVRRRAYSLVREFWKPNGEKHFFSAILEQCYAVNAEFAEPLPDKEARHVARSISRWVWRRFTPDRFHALQKDRGRKGGLTGGKLKGSSKRDSLLGKAKEFHLQGKSQRQIAAALGVTQKTISNWLKRE